MSELRPYRDAAGDPRADLPAADRLLGRYLESELQGSPPACRRLLRALERLQAGELSFWQETGNAHTLVLTPSGARIESEVDEDAAPWQGELERLRCAVAAWGDFLAGPGGSAP